jgi:hypothetical protein
MNFNDRVQESAPYPFDIAIDVTGAIASLERGMSLIFYRLAALIYRLQFYRSRRCTAV